MMKMRKKTIDLPHGSTPSLNNGGKRGFNYIISTNVRGPVGFIENNPQASPRTFEKILQDLSTLC